MNKSIKTIILIVAVLVAIALVLAFASTRAYSPKKIIPVNQFVASVRNDVERIKDNTSDNGLDSSYIAILDELEFMWNDSLLSDNQYDVLKGLFVSEYVPCFVVACNNKFQQSVWNEDVLNRIQSHIQEIKSLANSDNNTIINEVLIDSLNEVSNVVERYYEAKIAAKANGYNGLESARSRINSARDYAFSTPLCNCSELVHELNEVSDRLNNAHVRHLTSCVSQMSNYYYYHSKEQFDQLKSDVWNEIKSYKDNAHSVYGSVLDIQDIENNYTRHCQNANDYYSNISVSRTSLSFSSYGGSETITINCSGSWIISVNPNSWGHLSRSGNTLTLRVDANNNSSSRTDYFCVKCGSKEIRINIFQNGSSSSYSNSSNVRVTGSITSVWVDHNVSDSYGNKGMKIHVKFDISGMLNRTGRAVAYFYYSNGSALRDTNSNYRTTNGNVSVGQDFVPNYANCTFNDLTMFIPYTELHLSRNASCYFTVSIWNGNNEVAKSSKYNFTYSY